MEFENALKRLLSGKATKHDVAKLKELASQLPRKEGVRLSYTIAKYSAKYFPDILFELAEDLPRNVWYVKLMAEAAHYQYFLTGNWFSFFLEAYLTASKLPIRQRGLALTFLAMYIKDVDKSIAETLLRDALKLSLLSPLGIVGGVLMNAIKLAKALEIDDLSEEIGELIKLSSISPYEKVDLLVELAEQLGKNGRAEKFLKDAVNYARKIVDPELLSAACIMIRRAALSAGAKDIASEAEKILVNFKG